MMFIAEQLDASKQLNGISALLDAMLNTLKSILKKCGGYLDTSKEDCDCIYAVECGDRFDDMEETQITALKVEEDTIYYKTRLNGDEWRNLQYSDNYYLPTIVSIMENIFGYLSSENDRS